MIETRHWPLFMSVFGAYTANLFRRRFREVWVRGNLPADPAPLLIAVQHVAWWDPLVIYHLSRAHLPRAPHFVMMDEANLRKMRFFRWIGAFGVDRSTRAGAMTSLRYALDRLKEPGARVWVFAQGQLRPVDARPLGCEPGTSWLAARAGAPVVPIALRYEFGEDERPEIFASIGEPTRVGSGRQKRGEPAGQDPIEALLTHEADRLRDDLWHGRMDGFARVLRPQKHPVPRVIRAVYTPPE